jgi:hypothetical protein
MDVRKIVLHVERVILGGFQDRDQVAFMRALETELRRNLRAPKVGLALATRGNADRIEAKGRAVPRSLKAEDAGRWAARAIARGLRS